MLPFGGTSLTKRSKGSTQRANQAKPTKNKSQSPHLPNIEVGGEGNDARSGVYDINEQKDTAPAIAALTSLFLMISALNRVPNIT